MLTIRLARRGKKNQPSFRVVLAEKGRSAQGKFIEILGNYDPIKKTKSLKAERITHWISKGAQPSPTVHNLLVSEKIIDAKKIKAWRPKKKADAQKKESVPAA
ncbi:MAG: 30S ribosomal protein S16 [Parcubacteria group bacterium GW2011_GWA1_42_7]|nr:MAG: 30S ribosomal protein S16 [Parcubacteria group bacterium GW2011_GWB1_42_6]KKS70202.1 MAG: 30S ribosomal protein S16 [Parcubacteria group bacterium GW2011_GWA1_42_7]KKS92459.1 MAG: 30S ribosomal protein S16 [Parcubacteria group bacterium GW2011_GWC1_43_12]